MLTVSKNAHPLAAITGALLLNVLAAAPALAQDSDSAKREEPSGPIAPSATLAEGNVLPSTLVDYIHIQNHLQPDWNQGKIAAPLLPLAKEEGLSEHEQFFLGQLHFMAFKPRRAYEIFGKFSDRDDWYGWMARQRMQIMEYRAFRDFEALEKSVAYERENFRRRSEVASASISGFGERWLCNHWIENGDHSHAIELALASMQATPRDAAYYSLELPRTCFAAFEAAGREREAFSAIEDVLKDLSETLESRSENADDHAAYDPDLFENTVDDRWYGRSETAPYNYINYKLEQMIGRMEGFLACRRDGEEAACSG